MFTSEVPILPNPTLDHDSSNNKNIPVELQPRDVICDDLEYVNHVGNRRIIISISLYSKKCFEANTTSQKRAVAASIVDVVMTSYRPGGRFLKMDRHRNFFVMNRKEAIQWTLRKMKRLLPTKTSSSKQNCKDFPD
mmetsp:Transcript_30704/g.46513  ORF Transcript_30704/g.46513 Transcript_30704/m.46513 type:complete len:136 (+) Transcript_30704:91-498(+)